MSTVTAPSSSCCSDSSSFSVFPSNTLVTIGSLVMKDYGVTGVKIFKEMSAILASNKFSLEYNKKVFTIVGSSSKSEEDIKEILLQTSYQVLTPQILPSRDQKKNYQFVLTIIHA